MPTKIDPPSTPTAIPADPLSPRATLDEDRMTPDLEDDETEDELEGWDDDEDEELATFSPKQALGAFATVVQFSSADCCSSASACWSRPPST